MLPSALLLVPTALAAQVEAHVPSGFSLPDHVIHDVDHDGTLWALGARYKASAGTDGFRYVPYLGADAPRNFPLHLRLERASVGAHEVELDESADATRDGDVWTLDRGGARVVYELDRESVEQLVVLDDVSGGGEVRVSFTADTEMVRARHDGGFRFSNAFGEVLYGSAVAVAPDGATCRVPAVETEGGFDLVVPSEFVERTDGPLIIDPVISTGTIAFSTTLRFASVDMACDDDLAYVAAAEVAFSAVDHDILAYRVSHTINVIVASYVAPVNVSAAYWGEPSVAGRDTDNEFLVAATTFGAGSAIWGRKVKETNGAWTAHPTFAISSGTSSASRPDVGAIRVASFFATSRWLVVWEAQDFFQGTVVRAQLVDTDGILGSVIQLPNTVGVDESSPRIAESTGAAMPTSSARFRVAYLQESTIGHAIMTASISYGGTVVGPAAVLVPDGLISDFDISAPSNQQAPNGDPAYLVVSERRALLSNNRSIVATVCGGNTAFESTSVSTMSDEGRDFIQSRPTVAYDGFDFLIGYEERETPSGERDIFLCGGDVANGVFGLAERRAIVTDTTFVEQEPSLVTRWESSTSSGSGGFLGWTNVSFLTKVEGAHVTGSGFGIQGYQYCEATENSTGRRAWARATGVAGTATIKSIRISDAPPGAPCYVLVAAKESFVPLVAGSSGNLCLGGLNFGRFSNAVGPISPSGDYVLNFNPQAIAQPTGTIAAQPGSTWYFQAWFRDFNGQTTSNLSNGVAIPF